MDVRAYQTEDRDGCLAIFDSLTPHLTDPAERGSLEAFLDTQAHPIFVMEHEGAVIGCGGYSVTPNSDTADLRWGMIREDYRKNGLGRFLLLYRIREIGRVGGITMVRAETSTLSAPFYEKQGFRVTGAESQRIQLTKRLTVCS
jgi:N-acetylglutamate synthase-like GNAT family acetyltransferase